jgi:glutamine synthetase
MVFMVMLCAVVRAVDKYANLLRATVANTGNEHRLGANEAPPAIVSIFLGDQLNDIFEQLANGGAKSSKKGGELKLGVSTLPPIPKDSTDRNRTSPFAFTGNKFEFRMLGSSQSTAGPNVVLNTIVAEILSEFADKLEKSDDVENSAQEILSKTATEHKRIIFNGDNYTEDWLIEADKRGLPNIASSVESIKTLVDKDNVDVLEKHNVMSRTELHARMDVLLESYSKSINIEAQTMLNIAKRQILPACVGYSQRLAEAVNSLKSAGADSFVQKSTLDKTCGLISKLYGNIEKLEKITAAAGSESDTIKQAELCRENVTVAMQSVREVADELETIVDADLWPLPTYAEMLFLM